MTTEDRRHGKLLPSPVIPTTTVCFTIEIPNAVQYRAALLGQLYALGEWFTWDHPTDGTVCADCEEAAQLWRDAIANATFSDDCEMNMSCQDVADCIETNPAVQNAIAEQITNNQNNQTTIYETSVVGAPMNAQQRGATVATSEDCEPNSLFGSVTAIVEQLDRNNRDFLEIIEVGTNARERVSTLIAAVPLFETLPINEAIDYIDKLQSEILENYEAQWTDNLKDEYRCDLFCMIKDRPTCELTFQDLVEYYNNRLGTAIEPINFFGAVVQYFLLGTWAGSTVVDIMMLTQLSAWQQASSWTGVSLRTLQTVGLLGANDPNPDWEILCDECAEPPVDNCLDLKAGANGFYPSNSAGNPSPGVWGNYIEDQGLAPNNVAGFQYFYFSRTLASPITVNSFTYKANENFLNLTAGHGGAGSLVQVGTTPVKEYTFSNATHPGLFPWTLTLREFLTFPGNVAPSGTFRIEEFCYEEV